MPYFRNDWDTARCISDMKRHLQWRAKNLPTHRVAVEHLLVSNEFQFHPLSCILSVLHAANKRISAFVPCMGSSHLFLYLWDEPEFSMRAFLATAAEQRIA